MEFTIVGAGAIGGLAGAFLAQAGHPVRLVDADAEHRQAIRERRLQIVGEADFTVQVPILAPEDMQGPLSTVLLAVKSHHTDAALDRIEPLLAADGVVVSLQNGVNPPHMAERIGAERTIGTFVNFAGDVLAPGQIRFAGKHGALYIGELDGPPRPRTHELANALKVVVRTIVTDNIYGYLWAKQCEVCVFWLSALTNDSLADVCGNPEAWPAIRATVREAVDVTRALGIRLENIGQFDPEVAAYAADESAARMLTSLSNDFRRGQKPNTGMWRDLAVRKRHPEIEGTLGVLQQEARRLGQSTPMIDAIVQAVQEIEAVRRAFAWENLREMSALAERVPAST